MSDWDKRHALWREKFNARKDPPPGGWAAYLNAAWLARDVWFPRYALYLKSSAWAQRRYGVLKRARHKCQLCPATERLDVHHVTYHRLGLERIEDLRCLCRSCHRTLHEGRDTWVPLDAETRANRERRDVLRQRRTAANRPKTVRRPMAETAALKDRC